jgi:type IV secretory pathway VirB2 component (pilin)
MTQKHDYVKDLIIVLAVLCLAMSAFPSFAGSMAATPLPAATALRTLRDFFTGDFAFTVSIISLVVCSAMLAFGGADFGGGAKTFIWLAIILSFVTFAANLYTTWFSGAVIP